MKYASYTFKITDKNKTTELSTNDSELVDKIISSDIGRLFPEKERSNQNIREQHFSWIADIKEVEAFLEKMSENRQNYSIITFFSE